MCGLWFTEVPVVKWFCRFVQHWHVSTLTALQKGGKLLLAGRPSRATLLTVAAVVQGVAAQQGVRYV